MPRSTSYASELVEAITKPDLTLWDATSAMSSIWRANLPVAPARRDVGPRYGGWAQIRDRSTKHFKRIRPEDTAHLLRPADVAFIRRETEDGADLDALDAVNWGLGVGCGGFFARAWTESLRTDPRWPTVALREDELYPVDPGPWDVKVRIAQGSALDRLHPRDLPCVRAFDGARPDWAYAATVSFTHDLELRPVFHRLDRARGLHPSASEKDMPFERPFPRIDFQVTFADGYEDAVLELLDQALADGQEQVIVLPELASTESLTEEARARMDAHGSLTTLMVAGSFHRLQHERRENVTHVLLADCEPIQHTKLVAFTNEMSAAPASKEGIDEPEVRSVTVHQAGRWRMATLICKDLLVPGIADFVAALGVNVLLVPAMSASTDAFDQGIIKTVTACQAVVVLVNGPLTWDGKTTGACIRAGVPVNRSKLLEADPVGTAPTHSILDLAIRT